MVVFRPGLAEGQALNAILAAGAAPIAQADGIWVIGWQDRPSLGQLFAGGALLVGSGAIGTGCLSWTR